MSDGSVYMRLMQKGSAQKREEHLLCADIGNGEQKEIDRMEWVTLISRHWALDTDHKQRIVNCKYLGEFRGKPFCNWRCDHVPIEPS